MPKLDTAPRVTPEVEKSFDNPAALAQWVQDVKDAMTEVCGTENTSPSADAIAQQHAEADARTYLTSADREYLAEFTDLGDALSRCSSLRGQVWERLAGEVGRCGTQNGHFFAAADRELRGEYADLTADMRAKGVWQRPSTPSAPIDLPGTGDVSAADACS